MICEYMRCSFYALRVGANSPAFLKNLVEKTNGKKIKEI